jgi:hypothetical protein
MTFAKSAPSSIALLIQSSQPVLPSERSRSKRLHTFIHYEHLTYPRRFIILLFIIIIVSLSFACLIAGPVCPHETASYLESCANVNFQCASETNLTCSLTSLLCLCPEQTFWDNDKQKCLTVKSINQVCSTNQQCDTDKGLICDTDGTCQCPQNTYYTTTACTNKKSKKEKNN